MQLCYIQNEFLISLFVIPFKTTKLRSNWYTVKGRHFKYTVWWILTNVQITQTLPILIQSFCPLCLAQATTTFCHNSFFFVFKNLFMELMWFEVGFGSQKPRKNSWGVFSVKRCFLIIARGQGPRAERAALGLSRVAPYILWSWGR